MLVSLREVLIHAQKNKYGVGCFNTVNLEMAKGVLQAAEELNSPVIIGTAEVLLPQSTLEEVANIIIPMAKKTKVPVVVHFDHGLSENKVHEALRLGFSSIMYDCSNNTYEDNIQKVAEMTRIAKVFGASVEAELGHVGANDGATEATALQDKSVFTQPEEAKDYIERTGVDALAIAFGSAHGAYKFTPKLDIERLREIQELVDIPLVLHGGSGLTDEDFRKSIAHGISKINIFTDINVAYAKAIFDAYDQGKGITDLMDEAVKAVKEEVIKKMLVFGSNNKG